MAKQTREKAPNIVSDEDILSSPESELKPGTSWVIFTPPGWLHGVTIEAISPTYVKFNEVIYIDNVSSGKCSVSDTPLAETESAQLGSLSSWYMMPGGCIWRRDAIAFWAPSKRAMDAFIRKAAKDALSK